MQPTGVSILSLVLATVLSYGSRGNCSGTGFVRGQLGYVSDETKTGTTTTDSSRQYIDFTAGIYVMDNGLAIIGEYGLEKTKESQVNGDRSSYGAGIGWYSQSPIGMYVEGLYFISSEFDRSGTTYKGNGLSFGAGVRADLSKVVLVAGMTYETFTYNKTDTGALSPVRKESHIAPRLGVQIEF